MTFKLHDEPESIFTIRTNEPEKLAIKSLEEIFEYVYYKYI